MSHTRDDIARELERCEGNVRRAAVRLNLRREYVYRLIRKHELWPVVNQARVERIKSEPKDDLLKQARQTLKG